MDSGRIFSLSYGDIFTIIAEKNPSIHNHKYFINHISPLKVKAVDLESRDIHEFYLNEKGFFKDESIQSVVINYHDNRGYAIKNGLIPSTWIDILFETDVPFFITGQITDLIGDRIEITQYPSNEILYIDFEYKGIPETLPLKLTIREKPVEKQQSPIPRTEEIESGNELDSTELDIDTRILLEEDFQKGKDEIIFSDIAETVFETVELDEKKRLYSLEAQLSDLINTLLMGVKKGNKKKSTMSNISRLVDRYRQLYRKYTTKNKKDQPTSLRVSKKPLVEKMKSLDENLFWIVPTTLCKKQLFSDSSELDTATDAIIYNDESEILQQIKAIQSSYDKNRISFQEANKQIQQLLQPFDTSPFSQWIQLYTPLFLSDISPSVNTECIIDNTNNFESSVVAVDSENIPKFQSNFVTQTYLANDVGKIHLKSVLILPIPFIEFSRLYRNTTNILDVVSLSNNFILKSQLFHLIQSSVDNVDIQDTIKQSIGQKCENFPLIKNENTPIQSIDEALQRIIPDTYHILQSHPILEDAVRFNKVKSLSFLEFARQLDAFFITYDNINYKGCYKKIRYELNRFIKQWRQQMVKYNNEYSTRSLLIKSESTKKSGSSSNQTTIHQTFVNSNPYDNKQSMLDQKSTSAEEIKYFTANDLAKVAYMYLRIKNDRLVIDPKFLETVVATNNESNNVYDCTKRVLAKTYSSLIDLENDNDKTPIFHDQELDEIPYNIFDENKELVNAKKAGDLGKAIEILEKKFSSPSELSKDIADAYFLGNRTVKEGEFAFVDKPVSKYYQRQNNKWIINTEVTQESFLGSNSIFCMINDKCAINQPLNTCQPIASVQNKYIEEFRKRLETEDIVRSENNQALFDDLLRKFQKQTLFQTIQRNKHDNLANQLASTVLVNDESIHISPSQKYLSVIMQMKNMEEKQKYIVNFVQLFTRPPRIDFIQLEHTIFEDEEDEKKQQSLESPHWLYCKETNIPILPLFVYECANAYVLGGMEQFLQRQDVYIGNSNYSEDLSSYVDKNTGWVIRERELVDEVQWDDAGNVIQTSDVMTSDDSPMDKKEEHMQNKMSNTILLNLCDTLGINVENVKEMVIRISYDLIQNIESEQTYNNYMKAKFKGQTTFPPYLNHYYKHVIYSIAAVLFVRIQTSMVKIKRNNHKVCQGTQPNYTGYPLGNMDEQDGIKYMSCILNSMKTKDGYFASMDSVTTITTLLLVKLKYLSNIDSVKQLYKIKRNALQQPVSKTSLESAQAIKLWRTFLPPLYNIHSSKKYSNISTEVHKELLKLVSRGNKDQEDIIGLYNAKRIGAGLSMIELINDVIVASSTGALLKTAGNIPFVQNSCCNETKTHNTFDYFVQEKSELKTLLQISKRIETELSKIRFLERAPLFFEPSNTAKIINPSITTVSDTTMYHAIIYYLKLDNPELPIPSMFQDIQGIPKDKPENFHLKATEEKYAILKKDIKANEKMYNEILQAVHKENIITSNHSNTKINWIDDGTGNVVIESFDTGSEMWKWQRFLKQNIDVQQTLIYNEKDVLDTATVYTTIMRQFDQVVEASSIVGTASSSSATSSYTNIKLYLLDLNSKLEESIRDTLTNYDSSIDKSGLTKTMQIITSIGKLDSWDIWNDGGQPMCFQFVKDAIFNLGTVLPNMIRNGVTFQPMSKRWKFSNGHYEDLSALTGKNFYRILHQFQQTDKFVLEVLDEKEEYAKVWCRIAKLTLEHYPLQLGKEMELANTKLILYTTLWLLTVRTVLISKPDLQKEFVFDQEELNNRKEIQRVRAKMLCAFLDIENHRKTMIDKSAVTFTKETNVSKEIEKKRFTDLFKNMNKDSQRLLSQMKNLGLGIWYEGTKGLVNYDPNAYDRERKMAAEDQTNFMTANDVINVNQDGIETSAGDETVDGYDEGYDEGYDDDNGQDE